MAHGPFSLLTKAFGSALGTGYSPFASGTVASALAAVIYLIPGCENILFLFPLTIVSFALGVPAARAMEKEYGHDPAEVTIDEVVGMWISLLFLPKSIPVLTLAFLLFRTFDIVKPYPARKFDAMHGGLGIMLDDVVAGLYANLLLQFLLVFELFRKILL